MPFLISNRALLQGVMAGALVLASATACSRSDRRQDTSVAGDTAAAGYRAMERDTVTTGDAGRIRPTEDSIEVLGEGNETADEQEVTAEDPDR